MVLKGSALTQFLLEKSGQDWDAAPTFSGFRKDEHAFTALTARYKKERKTKLTDVDFESFGLALSDGRLTNTGALLADDCPLRHSRVFCTRWNGLNMAAGVMDAKDNQEFAGGLLSMLQYAEDFVRVNSRHSWHKLPRTRAEFVEYPERSVHEALVNAFIHRDYLVTGSEVHVDIFDDRIEITSPGGMPGERKIEDFDINCIPSIRRNPLLADMCERLRIMERRGSGFKKIFEDYTENFVNLGRREPVIESNPIYFRITLPNMIYGFTDEQLVAAAKNPKTRIVTPVATPVVTPVAAQDVPPVEKPSETLINKVQHKILCVLRGGLLSASEISAEIGISRVNNVRRRYLRLLLDMGFVEYTIPNKPNSKNQQYRLTARGSEIVARRSIGHDPNNEPNREPNDPNNEPNREPNVRHADIDQQIFSMIAEDGGCTILKMMGRFHVSRETVKRALKRLQTAGRLRRIGGTRGHWEVMCNE